MSIVSGTVGAIMGSNATESAAETGAAASDRATQATVDIQKEQLKAQQDALSPYGKIGAQGLAQMYGTNVDYIDPATGKTTTYAGQGGDFNLMQDPYTGQTMQMPSYDKEYTQGLGGYEEDPGTRAQRALDSKRLAEQDQLRVGYSTPGASASRSAELGQKYDVAGYDKFKGQLAERYKALQGEFAQKRAMTADRYDQLTQKMNLGLGVTKSLGSSGQNFANAVSGANTANAQNQATAATASGQAQAGLWSGLGAASANTASTGLKAYDYGQKAGWWGGASGTAAATESAPATEAYGAYLA